jgi:hypothetical protein
MKTIIANWGASFLKKGEPDFIIDNMSYRECLGFLNLDPRIKIYMCKKRFNIAGYAIFYDGKEEIFINFCGQIERFRGKAVANEVIDLNGKHYYCDSGRTIYVDSTRCGKILHKRLFKAWFLSLWSKGKRLTFPSLNPPAYILLHETHITDSIAVAFHISQRETLTHA